MINEIKTQQNINNQLNPITEEDIQLNPANDEDIQQDTSNYKVIQQDTSNYKEQHYQNLKNKPNSITDIDHPNAIKNWDELIRLKNNNSSGNLKLNSIWRGNLIPKGTYNHKHRSETTFSIPFPYVLRRDHHHGELWIKVNYYETSRLGLREIQSDASTKYDNSSWALLYGLNTGIGRDDEVIHTSISG